MKTILVQAGHLQPYQKGTEGQTGAAGELALNVQHRDALCRMLAKDGRFKPLPEPSRITAGTKCDAAVFFHADGSSNAKVSGYSFGYPDYPINRRLALLIADEYNKIPGHPPHHADNYTVDEHHYYGFGATDTTGPEVLFEVGFVSNPGERAWLEAHVNDTAGAVYHALLRHFALFPQVPPKQPQAKVGGYWQVTRTFYDGHKEDPVKTRSLIFWTLRHPLQKQKGVRGVSFKWIETA